jgi:hypothetical protein
MTMGDVPQSLQSLLADGQASNAKAGRPVPVVVKKRRKIEPPENWTWPQSPAMSAGEVDTMTHRIELFMKRGQTLDGAEALADRCKDRDRDGDDRRACLECAHVGRAGQGWYRCCNWRSMGWTRGDALLAGRFVLELHRCEGFQPGQVETHSAGDELV